MGMEYFGNKLKTLRKSKKWTQAELGARLDLSVWAITGYEQGRTYPSIEVLINLCRLFEVSSDYLLGISDDLPLKMSEHGLSEEETSALLDFLALIEHRRER